MSDIDTMSLDELRIAVARDIMGLAHVRIADENDARNCFMVPERDYPDAGDPLYGNEEYGIIQWHIIPDYPRDIAAAMPLMAAHTDATLEKAGDNWRCVLSAVWQGDGLTPEEAICRAALKAIRK